ncbi:hypothetical protein ACLHDG_06075 [Sulfurovum sp. CS9]|uniref:hypothetical protein n=1 Tax=Sulfurovum sp. CS9 TaxID=3391146 RepID=UPI0039EB987A
MKYIYTILAIVIIYFVGNDIYKQNTKTVAGAKSTRLACHKTCKVFERTYDAELLKKAQETVQAGEYKLTSSIKQAKFMETQMFKYVQLEKVDQMVKDAIETRKQADAKADGKVHIDYYIYENDKADPGKKTKKSKLYAGFLRFILTYNGKKFYSVQADFMNLEGEDIPKSVECAIESFMTAS